MWCQGEACDTTGGVRVKSEWRNGLGLTGEGFRRGGDWQLLPALGMKDECRGIMVRLKREMESRGRAFMHGEGGGGNRRPGLSAARGGGMDDREGLALREGEMVALCKWTCLASATAHIGAGDRDESCMSSGWR